MRAQGPNVEAVWGELNEAGLKPWIHRRLLSAAKLETDADVYHLAPFTHGRLEIQDIASQAVALICDPEPGERWWDASPAGGQVAASGGVDARQRGRRRHRRLRKAAH